MFGKMRFSLHFEISREGSCKSTVFIALLKIQKNITSSENITMSQALYIMPTKIGMLLFANLCLSINVITPLQIKTHFELLCVILNLCMIQIKTLCCNVQNARLGFLVPTAQLNVLHYITALGVSRIAIVLLVIMSTAVFPLLL